MPHPKNHMKLTGDTHPPESDRDFAADDGVDDDEFANSGREGARFDDAALRMDAAAPAPEPFWTDEPAALTGAREFTREQPLLALGMALFAGYALLKILRR